MNEKQGVVVLKSLDLSQREKRLLLKLKEEVPIGIAS
jgi:hypothetical protein